MKTCFNCGELVGDNVDICFKCKYNFKTRSLPVAKSCEEVLTK